MALTNESLADLCRDNYAELPHVKVYKVSAHGHDVFAIAPSPGQAATSVCSVSRVPHKELSAAAFAALATQQKGK